MVATPTPAVTVSGPPGPERPSDASPAEAEQLRLAQWTRPGATAALGLAAALLVALQSTGLLLVSGLTRPSDVGSLGVTLGGIAVVGIMEAIVLGAVSILAYLSPQSHVELGVLIVTMALLSLYVGGGFFLGTLLGWVAGVLAIFYEPRKILLQPVRAPVPEIEDDPVAEADLLDSGVVAPGRAGDEDTSP